MTLHPIIPEFEISILNYISSFGSLTCNVLKIIDGGIRMIKTSKESLSASTTNKISYRKEIFLVTNYQKSISFTDFYLNCNLKQIKQYIKALLTSLSQIHQIGIMHRDVKPDNFLINIETNEFILIDFGMAQCVLSSSDIETSGRRNSNEFNDILELQKNKCFQNRIGTRGFLAPEMIMYHDYQDCKVDVWAVGVILACFFFKKYPPFSLNKFSLVEDETIRELAVFLLIYNKNSIVEISRFFGATISFSTEFNGFEFNDTIEEKDEKNTGKSKQTVNSNFFKKSSKNIMEINDIDKNKAFKDSCKVTRQFIQRDDIDEDGVKFLLTLLTINPTFRPTSLEALSDKWLNS